MPVLHEFQPALGTLASFQERGAVRVRFWCLGCDHREDQDIALLIGSLSPGASMIDLAKRAICRKCQHRGAYVAPVWGLPKKHTGYYANLERVKSALQDQIDYITRMLG